MWRRLLSAAVAVVIVAGCGSQGPEGPDPAGVDATSRLADQHAALARLADEDPAALLARVRASYDGAVLRATVTPRAGVPYRFLAGPDAWRAESAAGTVLEVDGEVCFDHAFGERLAEPLAASYGAVELDPQPWACTPSDFGLNTTATHGYRRTDPRWRLDHLTTDAFDAVVDDHDGVPLLHVRTTGVTADGPLDPTRPTYDLWIDADHRPVRMETADASWAFTHPADAGSALEAPGEGQRGSYGYNLGPGQGPAKACFYGGGCDRSDPMWRLTWGDGRTG